MVRCCLLMIMERKRQRFSVLFSQDSTKEAILMHIIEEKVGK